jgi:transcription-repair coupling factor (superfamily II helicase)
MQDLDIRGAGNLLGGEQSGFIADIGFEAYQRILAEAAMELREEEGYTTTGSDMAPSDTSILQIASDIQVDTDLEIMFPDEYISNIPERIRLYRELNEIKDEKDLSEYESRLADRFGPVPPQARSLLGIVRLKWLAGNMGMEKITLRNGIMVISFDSDQTSRFYRSERFAALMNYVNRRSSTMKMRQKETRLTLTVSNIQTIAAAQKMLTEMSVSSA